MSRRRRRSDGDEEWIPDPRLERDLTAYQVELEKFKTASGPAYAAALLELHKLSRRMFLALALIDETDTNQRRTALNLLQETVDSFKPSEIDSSEAVADWQRFIQERFDEIVGDVENHNVKKAKERRGDKGYYL